MDRDTRPEGNADVRRLVRRAEALRRRYIRRLVRRILRRLAVAMACRRAESELGALSDRALHDLGVDRGGIMYAVRYGRRGAPDIRAASVADVGAAIGNVQLQSEDT